jgi:nitric oxide reductase activation protein
MELERCHRQRQGDDIDLDAAIEAEVEGRAGVPPREDVYIDSLRRRRDLSVLVLLDVSGSAGDPSATGAPVHHHQRATAGALTTALHELGDRVALYGFRSQGRSAVHVLPVKQFDDRLDTLVFRRLSHLTPAAYTRLGAAVRHATSLLERHSGTSRRLLVVVSDGFAYDHGYERAYGEQDARRALAEARRRGIGCLCLSVGAATDPVELQRVFGTAAHAVVPRVEQLPAVVGPLFRSAFRSADHQRTRSQRRDRAVQRLHRERGKA